MASKTKRITVTTGYLRTVILTEFWDITPVSLTKTSCDRYTEYQKDNHADVWTNFRTGKVITDRSLHQYLDSLCD